MPTELGAVVEGKVTGITKFGAFVSMPDGKSGLVHISEIADTYVNDVHDYLQEGQLVKVKVVGVSEDGKINLSIKRAAAPGGPDRRAPQRYGAPRGAGTFNPGRGPARQAPPEPAGEPSFEDKLKRFMQESDSRMSGNKLYADRKGSGRRRRD